MTYYVSMTDKFMSGWGYAKDKINKFIIVCDNFKQAEIIERNAKERPEMKYVNICSNKPSLPKKRYLLSFRHFDELGSVWTQ